MKGIAIFGATGGLGEAMARRIAKRAPVTLGYRGNERKAAALVSEIVAAGGKAVSVQVDMTDEKSVKRFVEQAASQWGGLCAIVSATGPALPLGPVAEISEEDFRNVYETDVFGSFRVLKHGAAALKAGGGGAIVLTATTAMLRTLENDGMSGGPKAAVVGLVRQMAREMGPDNVRFNAIAPGIIDGGSRALGPRDQPGRPRCGRQLPEPHAARTHGPAGGGCRAGRFSGLARGGLHHWTGDRDRWRVQRLRAASRVNSLGPAAKCSK